MNEPIKLKSIFNPTSEDLHFKYNSAEYVVKAGKSKELVSHIALHAAKKLADKNIMTNNPDEFKVLANAYLENSEPEVIAKNLNIDLNKIRKEAMTKEKEKARVMNLEAQGLDQNKKIEDLENKLNAVLEMKKEEIKKEVKKVVEPKVKKVVDNKIETKK